MILFPFWQSHRKMGEEMLQCQLGCICPSAQESLLTKCGEISKLRISFFFFFFYSLPSPTPLPIFSISFKVDFESILFKRMPWKPLQILDLKETICNYLQQVYLVHLPHFFSRRRFWIFQIFQGIISTTSKNSKPMTAWKTDAWTPKALSEGSPVPSAISKVGRR